MGRFFGYKLGKVGKCRISPCVYGWRRLWRVVGAQSGVVTADGSNFWISGPLGFFVGPWAPLDDGITKQSEGDKPVLGNPSPIPRNFL